MDEGNNSLFRNGNTTFLKPRLTADVRKCNHTIASFNKDRCTKYLLSRLDPVGFCLQLRFIVCVARNSITGSCFFSHSMYPAGSRPGA